MPERQGALASAGLVTLAERLPRALAAAGGLEGPLLALPDILESAALSTEVEAPMHSAAVPSTP